MVNTKFISTVAAENNGAVYATNLTSNHHMVVADEPLTIGGTNAGPSPADLICMSLASCKAITLRMYVERKQWNIQNIKVKVSLERADTEGMVTHTFRAEIFVDEPVPNEQKERLLYIAKACPISKLLSKQNEVITKLAT